MLLAGQDGHAFLVGRLTGLGTGNGVLFRLTDDPRVTRVGRRYGTEMRRRFAVKPGLTGLWQVSGRSNLSWDESIRIDVHDVENWSLVMDLMIIWWTFGAVVRGRGAY